MNKYLLPILFMSLLFWNCEDTTDSLSDEAEVCVEDNCGVCDDDPTNDCTEDCTGEWGGEGICGCTDSTAINYNSDATFDDGSCITEVTLWGTTYSIENINDIDTLNLSYSNLSGDIPPEIGYLTNLTYMNLGSNQLTGSIPSEIGNLTNLT